MVGKVGWVVVGGGGAMRLLQACGPYPRTNFSRFPGSTTDKTHTKLNNFINIMHFVERYHQTFTGLCRHKLKHTVL